MNYRADLDGLRAVAVLAVLLYHADIAIVSGGFVGVDVFFVISGFLITKIVLQDLSAGTFTISHFYERRIRRVIPALFMMVIATLSVSFFFLLPQEYTSLGASGSAAMFFTANLFFFETGDYFSQGEIRPLLHTWSLGVEEQFYIIFPLIIALLLKLRISVKVLRPILVGAFIFSFLGAVGTVQGKDQSEAFFLPHLRAWEILLGALIAAYAGAFPKGVKWGEAGTLIGLALILCAVFIYDVDTQFPGVSALIPCLGAALVILSYSDAKFISQHLLQSAPVVWIGKISYSLYLWHYPVFSLYKYVNVQSLNIVQTCCAMLVSFIFAYLSYKFVEQPFRYSAFKSYQIMVSAAIFSLVPLVIGLIIWSQDGLPKRLSKEAMHYAEMLDKEQYFEIYDRGGCFLDHDQSAVDYQLSECAVSEAKPSLLIWGDSFAANLFPGLSALSEFQVHQYTSVSCRPIEQSHRRCGPFIQRFHEVASSLKPDVIILAGLWSSTVKKVGKQDFAESIKRTISAAQNTGATVIVAGNSPTYKVALPQMARFDPDLRVDGDVLLTATDNREVNSLLAKIARSENAAFFDFYDLCEGLNCIAFKDGAPLHWDFGHMTKIGSLHYATPLIELISRLLEVE